MSNECVVIEDTDLSEDEPGPARRLHKPNACRLETKWFQEEYQAPSGQVKDFSISSKDILFFQDLIWNHPHDRMVPGYGMTPRELASVPSDGRKGWLVSSHFFWLSQCLNKQTTHSRCFVFDAHIRKESVDKLLPSDHRFKVTTLILVMSVGRRDDGCVFFGTDKMQGDHWAVSVIDIKEGSVYYCDTLGWAAPRNILSSIIKYTRFAGLVHSQQLTLKMSHEPNDEQHICTNKCTNYPLQKCSDVCGVVAMVCIAAAALDKKLFNYLMQPLDEKVHLYLREPTEYSCYLRYVLISWLAQEHIDIAKISLKSDFNPYTPLSKVNTIHTGIKRKWNDDSIPQSAKRSADSSGSAKTISDDVSMCILQHASDGASSSTILKEAAQAVVKKCKEKSYWKNVCQELTFNNSIEICRDQTLSISEYYQEFMKTQNNPIIFFNMFAKGQGKNYNCLDDNDIVLVIQTDYQREMLRTYCKQCVCVDWTRKSEESGIHFNLITMSVFVEGLYEVPVAWLISNKSNPSVQNYLFEAVKKKVGEIQTDIFIGDLASTSYKYWTVHFKKPKKKMFCVWDIVHVLKTRLETFISDSEICKRITKHIGVFPHISDRDAFDIYKTAFLENIKQHSVGFHSYFVTKYLDEAKDEQWASCYRVIPAASFVPFLHPFRHTLNAVEFFKSGQMDRIDVTCHKLMQFVMFLKRKLYIMASGVKQASAIKEIQRLHQQPYENLDFFQSISGEEWYVKASGQNISFSVLDSGLDSCKCTLQCTNCTICIHRYVCSCTDYILFAGGCKHIHLRHAVNKLNNTLNGANSSVEKNDHGTGSKTKSNVLKELHRLSEIAHDPNNDSKLKAILKALRNIDE